MRNSLQEIQTRKVAGRPDTGLQKAVYRYMLAGRGGQAIERRVCEVLGRRGGLKAAQLSAKARRAIGKRLAAKRWKVSTEGEMRSGRRGGR